MAISEQFLPFPFFFLFKEKEIFNVKIILKESTKKSVHSQGMKHFTQSHLWISFLFFNDETNKKK